jgi:hypothetical protein
VTPVSSKQPNAGVMSGCAKAVRRPESSDLSVSGQRETANGFVVNGSSVQEDFNLFAAVVPNLDSIKESRAQRLARERIRVRAQYEPGGADFFAPARAKYGRHQFGGRRRRSPTTA